MNKKCFQAKKEIQAYLIPVTPNFLTQEFSVIPLKSEYTVFIRKVLHSNISIPVSLDKLSNDKESLDRELGLLSSQTNADILAPFVTYLYSNFSGIYFKKIKSIYLCIYLFKLYPS